MGRTRLELAKDRIIRRLTDGSCDILRPTDIDRLLSENRETWHLAQSTTRREFVRFLSKRSALKETVLRFPTRKETRYLTKEVSVYRVALSVKPEGYFSHYTALRFHNLTDQIPKVIYLNAEQRPKPPAEGRLEQGRIDAAFKCKPRVTNNTARYGDYTICILNGKHTGGLGVVAIEDESAGRIRVTGLERTLIDAAVRPFYAGGVFEVLTAFRRAKSTLAVPHLIELLSKLDFIYPYHQAIGFYLERAGYEPSGFVQLRARGLEYDFYLTRQMRTPDYSSRWRLFFPKGL